MRKFLLSHWSTSQSKYSANVSGSVVIKKTSSSCLSLEILRTLASLFCLSSPACQIDQHTFPQQDLKKEGHVDDQSLPNKKNFAQKVSHVSLAKII